MALRIVMPNGTTKSFREGTPKSVIRQMQADMIAAMKATGEYDGIDFDALEKNFGPKKRAVEVTQYEPDDLPQTREPLGPVAPGDIPPTPSATDIPVPVQSRPATPAPTPSLSTRGFTKLPQPNEVEVGEGGTGYGVYGIPPNGEGQWGSPRTMQVISAVANHLANGAREVPLNIGNISKKNGGPFPPHINHQTGDGIDVRPPRLDQKNNPADWRTAGYDRAGMQQLVNAFHATGAVEKIYFNDPQIRGVVPASGHDNHFHVQLKKK
jgi:hypothetical protein